MLVRTMLVAAAVALLAPAAASAASKPGVRTGGVSNVTFNSATLNGRVDPNKADTTYFFRYGTTRVFTTDTAPAAAGSGADPARVSTAVAGLAPLTQYHYRLVAQNRLGTTVGEWRTFTTKRQPLGVTLAANPNPVAPGGATVLAGQLTGTNSAGRDVVLQSNPFPYTQGFVGAANPQVTGTDGTFSFPVLSVPVTTQFRVVLAQRAEVTSPIVVVGAALQVRTDTEKVARHRHSVSVRFRGSVSPQNDGGRVGIQKFRNGVWTEIAHTRAKDAGSSKSVYNTRVRIYRSGLFRTVAEAEGQYVSGAGRAIRIKVRR
ncbi:MAG TPA: hypothetical protein VKA84_05350 [Gemmatimonadaceae bacterium]|nr:hypothetical protein [Gemmatimonadaceae bacterium]